MAQHGSVEQELWNIFTFYTLHGNPMYPDLLKSSQFSKLCKQCLIMKTPEMPNGLPGAVINVVYIGKFFLLLFLVWFVVDEYAPGKRAVERYLVHYVRLHSCHLSRLWPFLFVYFNCSFFSSPLSHSLTLFLTISLPLPSSSPSSQPKSSAVTAGSPKRRHKWHTMIF